MTTPPKNRPFLELTRKLTNETFLRTRLVWSEIRFFKERYQNEFSKENQKLTIFINLYELFRKSMKNDNFFEDF